jgi:hypothetical protein
MTVAVSPDSVFSLGMEIFAEKRMTCNYLIGKHARKATV